MEPKILYLNVGGKVFATTTKTLQRIPNSYLCRLINDPLALRDESGRLFIDRNPDLFSFVLDFYRVGKQSIPRRRDELLRLSEEAKFYQLNEMAEAIAEQMKYRRTCITIGYRGTFSSTRDGSTDLRFRKLTRILVSGQTQECRRIFGDSLNDTREPDIDNNYSCRFYLKHSVLEQAFDLLCNNGYDLVSACASGTNSVASDVKFGQDEEELRWQHYNEFIFVKNDQV
ncbi:unnamed protein product [Dicrocoelium dendriticum]|nr:unnamed protein product [Dicrocoelium dendriticum]